jgi:hypothetical protein
LQSITSLRPNVSREDAIETFGRSLWRRLRLGPLRSVAELYVPFRMFTAEISSSRSTEQRIIAVDLARGSLDLYAFEALPTDSELISVESRNVLPSWQSREASAATAQHKVQRVLFQTGFFKLRDLRIQMRQESDIYIPYWVGFFGSERRLNLAVMDATRRTIEGGRLRQLVKEWLEAPR